MPTAIVPDLTGAVGVSLLNKLFQEEYFIYVIVRQHSYHITNLPAHKNLKIIHSNLENLVLVNEQILERGNVFIIWHGGVSQVLNEMIHIYRIKM